MDADVHAVGFGQQQAGFYPRPGLRSVVVGRNGRLRRRRRHWRAGCPLTGEDVSRFVDPAHHYSPWTLPPQLTSVGAARNRRTTAERFRRRCIAGRPWPLQYRRAAPAVVGRPLVARGRHRLPAAMAVPELNDRRRPWRRRPSGIGLLRSGHGLARSRSGRLPGCACCSTGVDELGGGFYEIADLDRAREPDVAHVRSHAVGAGPSHSAGVPGFVDPLEHATPADVAGVSGVSGRGEKTQVISRAAGGI